MGGWKRKCELRELHLPPEISEWSEKTAARCQRQTVIYRPFTSVALRWNIWTTWIISRWVSCTNTLPTFASLQLYLRGLESNKNVHSQVRVNNLWSSVGCRLFVHPTSHRQIKPELSQIFLSVSLLKDEVQSIDCCLPVWHLIGCFYQICFWYFERIVTKKWSSGILLERPRLALCRFTDVLKYQRQSWYILAMRCQTGKR
jgi:hypothetical protein